MAHSKQAKKRIRQNDRRRMQNKLTAGMMRTAIKKLLTAVSAGDREAAQAALPHALSHIDKAAKHNVLHDNAAARKKGQAMRAVASLAAK